MTQDPSGARREAPDSGAPPLWTDRALTPAVAGRPGRRTAWIIFAAAALGLITLLWLSAERRAHADDNLTPTAASHSDIAAPAPPLELTAFETQGRTVAAPAATSPITAPLVAQQPPVTLAAASIPSAADAARLARLRAPSVVVDLAEPEPPAAAVATGGGGAGTARAVAGPGGPSGLTGNEQFAQRVGGEQPDRSVASMLRNPAATVAQGTMIPAVLETALDSDLPGYTRAVVSRDVRGFDGATILIPRGSRVIGQYHSAVSQGQSRAFVVWTRILRPDGGTIQIGSSGTDTLGRAGLNGSVNRHFFQNLSGAVLLSVLQAEISNLGNRPSTQVVIGSSQEATSLAASAILPTNIPPTIRVRQGTPIRIFVARDLDFSPAKGGEK